jgi:hypothetical protein
MKEQAGAGMAPTPGAGTPGAVTLADVRAAVNGVALWCPDDSPAVSGVVAADLMSDVLVDARPGYVLVTGLVNVQVIRTAAIADVAAVVFARGKAVPADVVDLARHMNVPAFASHDSLFEAAGRLYAVFGRAPATPAARRAG